jgi:methionyl-tRNA formyltransferase
MGPSVLFVGNRNDVHCEHARSFMRPFCSPESQFLLGKPGDFFPDGANWWEGDYIISYSSPWIIPKHLIARARIASINFHPGPPDYPGPSPASFAIYKGETTFGVSCHHMTTKIWAGKLITVKRFPIFEGEMVSSLGKRAYGYMLTLFYEIMSMIIQGATLPVADEIWTCAPYKWSELDELRRITPEMDANEVHKRVLATTWPGTPGAYVEIGGLIFRHEPRSSFI